MKNFLIGFLLAVVGCITAFIALATWLYADYTERKKERKYSDHSDYVDYARYVDNKDKSKYAVGDQVCRVSTDKNYKCIATFPDYADHARYVDNKDKNMIPDPDVAE